MASNMFPAEFADSQSLRQCNAKNHKGNFSSSFFGQFLKQKEFKIDLNDFLSNCVVYKT